MNKMKFPLIAVAIVALGFVTTELHSNETRSGTQVELEKSIAPLIVKRHSLEMQFGPNHSEVVKLDSLIQKLQKELPPRNQESKAAEPLSDGQTRILLERLMSRVESLEREVLAMQKEIDELKDADSSNKEP